MYEQRSSEAIGLIIGPQSPIPGHDGTFQDFHRDGDIGDFDNRWAWTTDSMLPAWRDGAVERTHELAELME